MAKLNYNKYNEAYDQLAEQSVGSGGFGTVSTSFRQQAIAFLREYDQDEFIGLPEVQAMVRLARKAVVAGKIIEEMLREGVVQDEEPVQRTRPKAAGSGKRAERGPGIYTNVRKME